MCLLESLAMPDEYFRWGLAANSGSGDRGDCVQIVSGI